MRDPTGHPTGHPIELAIVLIDEARKNAFDAGIGHITMAVALVFAAAQAAQDGYLRLGALDDVLGEAMVKYPPLSRPTDPEVSRVVEFLAKRPADREPPK